MIFLLGVLMKYSRLVSIINGLLLSSNAAAHALPVFYIDTQLSQNIYCKRLQHDYKTINLDENIPVLARH